MRKLIKSTDAFNKVNAVIDPDKIGVMSKQGDTEIVFIVEGSQYYLKHGSREMRDQCFDSILAELEKQ